jgi:hypothetical protein
LAQATVVEKSPFHSMTSGQNVQSPDYNTVSLFMNGYALALQTSVYLKLPPKTTVHYLKVNSELSRWKEAQMPQHLLLLSVASSSVIA